MQLREPMKPSTIIFHSVDGETVGVLTLDNPMTFEGDVGGSGSLFFKHVCLEGTTLHQKIDELKKQLDRATEIALNNATRYSDLADKVVEEQDLFFLAKAVVANNLSDFSKPVDLSVLEYDMGKLAAKIKEIEDARTSK